MNAEVLAELEGWGQAKRMVAKLCAEMHNVAILNRHADSGENTKPPKFLNEQHFLPKKVFKVNIAKTAEKNKTTQTLQNKLSGLINSMTGFG